MCFSATASFTASAILTTAGAGTLFKVKEVRVLPIASVPLLFGLQQGLEGLVWISAPGTIGYYFGMYGFLFCAYSLWPVLIPWSILIYERSFRRNVPLAGVATIGTFVGGYFFYELLKGGVSADLTQHSVCYSFWPPLWYGIGLCYIFVVILAGLMAKERFLKTFSIGLALSFVTARLLVAQSYPSVWCFFGALLSVVIIAGLHNADHLKPLLMRSPVTSAS